MNEQQNIRLTIINELVVVIANTDSQSFYNNKAISKFIAKRNYSSLISILNKKSIHIQYPISKARGFSDGGILWGLVNDFREWILTGKPSNGKHGYGGLYCTYWGYTIEGMEKVITKVKEIGFLQESDPSFREHCQSLLDGGYEWMLSKCIKQELQLIS